MKAIRILLVDDHQLVRSGIASLLQVLPTVRVVAEAANGRMALDMVEKHFPHIVLMDIAMPELNGLETTERVLRRFPTVKVIMLSMHSNDEYVLQALKVGASGFLLKDSAMEELEMAINAVFRGECFLSSAVSRRFIDSYLKDTDIGRGPWTQLTSRQREVLQLIAEGQTTKEIAFSLKISVKTAEAHRKQLMDRLGIHDVAGLVRYALRTGIIHAE